MSSVKKLLTAIHLLLILPFVCCSCVAISQELTGLSQRWKHAGNKNPKNKGLNIFNSLPRERSNVVDVVEVYGLDPTGETDVAREFQEILLNSSPETTFYFPYGKYLFKSSITLPSGITIKGRSPTLTRFVFDLEGRNENLIKIHGSYSDWELNYKSSMPVGTKRLRSDSLLPVSENDVLLIDQDNYSELMYTQPNWEKEWAKRSIGELVRVARVRDNSVEITQPLSYNYRADHNIKLRGVNTVKNVTLQYFKITRLDDGIGVNISFRAAENCAVECIHSTNPTRFHISFRKSINNKISSSYFNDAQYHCNGGAGYGIFCADLSNYNLIENNIFRRLRHAMMVKEGANNNVFVYNYSVDGVATTGNIWSEERCNYDYYEGTSAISFHGHYPSYNLFEQNVVSKIHIADYWGPAGPNNTLFRNYAYGEKSFIVSDFSQNQIVVGNVVKNAMVIDSTISNIITEANSLSSVRITNTDNNLPKSLYYSSKPFFFLNENFPSIGPDLPGGSSRLIPAEVRWKKKVVFNEACCGPEPSLESDLYLKQHYFFYQHNNSFFIESELVSPLGLTFMDSLGNVVIKNKTVEARQNLKIPLNLPTGMYIVKIISEQENISDTVKFLVN